MTVERQVAEGTRGAADGSAQAVIDDAPAVTPIAGSPPPRRQRARWLGWAAAVGVVALVLARSSTEALPVWTAKSAVALVLTGIAVPQLILLLRRPGPLRRTAVAATVFLGAVALAVVASPLIGVGFFGAYGASLGVGWIFYLALVAFWALGATVDDAGTRLITDAIVISCVLDAAASVLSVFSNRQSSFSDLLSHIPGIFVSGGQSLGLMDNSVFSGGLLTGGIALLIYAEHYRSKTRLELLAVLALGLELSGSRFGLFFTAAVLLWFGVRKGVAPAARALGAVALGVLAGYLLDKLVHGSDVGARIAGTGAGGAYGPRLTEWIDAVRVAAHHPLLGVGPAQGMDFITPYYSRTFSADSAPFRDAHNLFVELLLTTGLVGVLCFVAWLIPALRRARGPLLAGALGMLAIGMVEPLYVGLTPIAFLALGAASNVRRQSPLPPRPSPAGDDRVGLPGGSEQAAVSAPPPPGGAGPAGVPGVPDADRATAVLRVVTVAVAVAAAVSLLAGDALLHSGQSSAPPSTSDLEAAQHLLPPWPAVPEAIAPAYSGSGTTPSDGAVAVSWLHTAIDRDPRDFSTWDQLGTLQLQEGDTASAAASFRMALTLFPWSPIALSGMGTAQLALGRPALALSWFRKADETAPTTVTTYQASCLTHALARTSDPKTVLEICPATPPLLQLLGSRPPGWVVTPGVTSTAPAFPGLGS